MNIEINKINYSSGKATVEYTLPDETKPELLDSALAKSLQWIEVYYEAIERDGAKTKRDHTNLIMIVTVGVITIAFVAAIILLFKEVGY